MAIKLEITTFTKEGIVTIPVAPKEEHSKNVTKDIPELSELDINIHSPSKGPDLVEIREAGITNLIFRVSFNYGKGSFDEVCLSNGKKYIVNISRTRGSFSSLANGITG